MKIWACAMHAGVPQQDIFGMQSNYFISHHVLKRRNLAYYVKQKWVILFQSALTVIAIQSSQSHTWYDHLFMLFSILLITNNNILFLTHRYFCFQNKKSKSVWSCTHCLIFYFIFPSIHVCVFFISRVLNGWV